MKSVGSLNNFISVSVSSSAGDLAESCFRYPIVEQYLKTKRCSKSLAMKYLFCRVISLIILLLACLYLGYYINLASITDEFTCNIRTGILKNDSTIPNAMQCKLVAVGIFQLLSYINLIVYILLAPVIVYATFCAPCCRTPNSSSPMICCPRLVWWNWVGASMTTLASTCCSCVRTLVSSSPTSAWRCSSCWGREAGWRPSTRWHCSALSARWRLMLWTGGFTRAMAWQPRMALRWKVRWAPQMVYSALLSNQHLSFTCTKQGLR